jgi:hypothetical protein
LIGDLVVIVVIDILQVDLTEYVEKHEFVFDAVLNEEVSNDEVSIFFIIRNQVFLDNASVFIAYEDLPLRFRFIVRQWSP